MSPKNFSHFSYEIISTKKTYVAVGIWILFEHGHPALLNLRTTVTRCVAKLLSSPILFYSFCEDSLLEFLDFLYKSTSPLLTTNLDIWIRRGVFSTHVTEVCCLYLHEISQTYEFLKWSGTPCPHNKSCIYYWFLKSTNMIQDGDILASVK